MLISSQKDDTIVMHRTKNGKQLLLFQKNFGFRDDHVTITTNDEQQMTNE
jgi:hypothetical protein